MSSKDFENENAELESTEVVAAVQEEEVQEENEVKPIVVPEDYEPVEVNVKSLLDAGAHFGHKVDKWNPKMLPFIYGERNGVHIINLDSTISAWVRARKFVQDYSSRGGSILFVGTKLQAQPLVKAAAERCGAYYVNHRWLGGTLSNFQTIKNSIKRMRGLEDLLEKSKDPANHIRIAKKERLSIARQLEKLNITLGGIRDMKKLPDLLFIIDIQKENIAVSEARKLHLPVVALTDTNVDPNQVNFAIPSNDDAARTIGLFANAIADAVIEGRKEYLARIEADAIARSKGDARAKSNGKAQAVEEASQAEAASA